MVAQVVELEGWRVTAEAHKRVRELLARIKTGEGVKVRMSAYSTPDRIDPFYSSWRDFTPELQCWGGDRTVVGIVAWAKLEAARQRLSKDAAWVYFQLETFDAREQTTFRVRLGKRS
jgi:hypothetical protein